MAKLNDDVAAVVREAEAQGWVLTEGKKYPKMRCPCGKHQKLSIHLTPSDPNYSRNLRMWFYRQECWKG